MSEFGRSMAHIQRQIQATFTVPEPLMDRRRPDPFPLITRMRKLGYFGEESALDRRALSQAYGLGEDQP